VPALLAAGAALLLLLLLLLHEPSHLARKSSIFQTCVCVVRACV
jgi:hypothetical protein